MSSRFEHETMSSRFEFLKCAIIFIFIYIYNINLLTATCCLCLSIHVVFRLWYSRWIDFFPVHGLSSNFAGVKMLLRRL